MENNFWQYSVVFKPCYKQYFLKIKQNIFNIIHDKSVCKTSPTQILKQDSKHASAVVLVDENLLLVAVENEFKHSVQAIIKTTLEQILCKQYKYNYFASHIKNLDNLGSLKQIFLKVLTIFDTESDVLEIEKQLRLDNMLFLDEFYHFKLQTLTKKWQNICDMIDENSYFFSSSNLTLELIRFLLKNVQPKNNFLTLDVTEQDVVIYDEQNNVIYTQSLQDDIQNTILKILDNYPKHIYLKNSQNLGKQASNLIYLMFKNILKPLYFV